MYAVIGDFSKYETADRVALCLLSFLQVFPSYSNTQLINLTI